MAVATMPEMPNGPVFELYGQRKTAQIPYGLKQLMEDLARETIRTAPDNIYEFLAKEMESRLGLKRAEDEKRKAQKSWEFHSWSWERSSVLSPKELSEFLEFLKVSLEDANHYATIIQTMYRKYLSREKFGMKLQSDVMCLLFKLGLSVAKGNRYATIIQTIYRGHLARKLVEQMKYRKRDEFVQGLPIELHDANRFATIIQSTFRGYSVRSSLRATEKVQVKGDDGAVEANEELSTEGESEQTNSWEENAEEEENDTDAFTEEEDAPFYYDYDEYDSESENSYYFEEDDEYENEQEERNEEFEEADDEMMHEISTTEV